MSNFSGMRQLVRLPVFEQLRRRIQAMPMPPAEDSILLRVLVQALVVVGIVAVDVAAEVGPGDVPISFWAVPLSIVGATWSWYRRRDRNIALKFLLAIAMLMAMFAFFGQLLGQIVNSTNDSRLVLAQLLIQLQVLHSFDIPRRKDLGYSTVIGLILLGVAGTLSQTLSFAPLLLIFLAIALPVLVLDYRSRLGLTQEKRQRAKGKIKAFNSLSFRAYFLSFIVILTLGLTIFLLMPRLPGYQLRSFPVSLPNSLKNRDFLGNQRGGIINPGYVKEGKDGAGQGKDRSKGPGEMDDTFYYGFDSQINQNLRGMLKPKEVMRVRSQAAGFWRVLAFDRYTGQGWEISRNEKTLKLNRPEWSYKFVLSAPGVSFQQSREVIQSYTMVSELPNLIPALSYPKELYFPTSQVEVDTEGGMRSPGILPEGLTYTVISDVPYRDRTLLGKATTDYPKNIRDYYLQIPPKIADKVRQKTEEILANSNKVAKNIKPINSPYEKALYLAQYLKQRYSFPKDPMGFPYLAENEDLVEAFLFKYQAGYPDHFSTVLTVMLRSIGIPARLVGGYAPGQFNPFTGLYVVRNVDAYAMTEVYFPKYGWFAFDPIPGHELIPPSIEENQTFGVLKQFWNWIAGWLPSPVTSWLSRVLEIITGWIVGAIIWLWMLLSSGWVGLFTGSILLIGLAFLGWLGWNWWQAWRYHIALAKLPPMESVYQQMLAVLATKGLRKHPAQTPLEYAKTLHQHYPPTYTEAIDEISQAYIRWRYGGQMPNLQYIRQRLRELIKSIQKSTFSNQISQVLRLMGRQ